MGVLPSSKEFDGILSRIVPVVDDAMALIAQQNEVDEMPSFIVSHVWVPSGTIR